MPRRDEDSLTKPTLGTVRQPRSAWTGTAVLRGLILLAGGVFFGLHFVHLGADFPNNSPWVDWSKYTDEGWYADAAVRHYLLGHWYLAGDFNPAVALPFWPLLLGIVFHFTGVSLIAARACTVCVFGAMLWALYVLIGRFSGAPERSAETSLAAPLAVLMLCVSPFVFVFSRVAILEPLLAALTVVALLVASYLGPPNAATRRTGPLRSLWPLWPQLVLGLLLPAMVLTKTTAVALFPAIGYMLWHRAGCRVKPALRLAALPVVLGGGLWAVYYFACVRPHFLEDYQYLFSANGYTGFQLQPLATVLYNTVADGSWMGSVLYPVFFAGLVLALFLCPSFLRSPLAGALLLWIVGYFAFLAYHNNLQPRYYLVPAVAITTVVALLLEEFRRATQNLGARFLRGLCVAVATLVLAAILLPDATLQTSFLRSPEYTFAAAAQGVAQVVRANPQQSPLLLSISGSDLTLMTGLPSIDDDFGTLDLDQRVRQYRPGWYVAWNRIDDDKMDALSPLYHPVRVASFPAMDDPDRNELILYRLDPAMGSGLQRRRKLRLPKPLRTRLGQQPTTNQLQH